MNILVVNENFTGGGLETHIHSYFMELREKHHFVFAFGNFKSDLEFYPEDVHVGFHFGWRSSIENFIDDVERLIQLIHEEKIDVIHAHPFHSIFPAVVAGQLTRIPVVCTHHGAPSFAFPGGINEALLLYYAYTELVSCVFSVSNTGKLALEERAHVPNVVFMPNAVDSKLYRRHRVVNNRRWAAVSRLDADVSRVATMKKLFDMLPQLPIDGVDVYGDGTQRKDLEDYVVQRGLTDQVQFMGFCADLYDRLDGHYNGVIGSGRVVLEGLTMGYPVLVIGFGRVCGLLYGDLLQQVKGRNFVANVLPGLNGDAVAAQLEQVYAHPERFDFRQEMVGTFDIQIIAEAYVKQLSALSPAPHANMVTWFEAVKALPTQEANFYGSQDVFRTMQECIRPYAVDRNMMDLFLLGSNCAGLRSEIGQSQAYLAELLGQAQARILSLEGEQARLWEQAQARSLSLEREQARLWEQAQAQILSLEEGQRQLQLHLQEQTEILKRLQEQTEYHGKVLAPLIWIRRSLSRIKWTIKGWLN